MTILQYDLEGYLLDIHEDKTLKEIANELKIDYTGLCDNLNNKLERTGRFQFRRQFSNRIPNKIADVSSLKNGRYGKIHKYYKGRYITTYDSVVQAADKNNLDAAAIFRVLEGEIKQTGGYNFIYATLQDN
ncbi:MAG: hypothetical protein ACLFMO_08350 [Eubacteriales bacterium]